MHKCFFFNDTATTEIYTLSLHDALPISSRCATPSMRTKAAATCRDSSPTLMSVVMGSPRLDAECLPCDVAHDSVDLHARVRSEEHTSELQSRQYLVCRLLLEKKHIIVQH